MSRVHWKNQYTYIESQSLFHNKVRELFTRSNIFKHIKCYQEVAVIELIPEYPHRLHRYDWYLEEFNTIVELHGNQHYKMTNYGSLGYDEAQNAFKGIVERDAAKKYAALESGFKYKEIPYKYYNKLTCKLLENLLLKD